MVRETRKRSTYSPEFKAKIGLEAVRGVKTDDKNTQAPRDHPVQVGQWKKEILGSARELFDTKRGPKPKAQDRARKIGCMARLVA